MPGVTAGVYTGSLDAGTEVSSTYEGRHITMKDNELIHPKHADGFVDKGDPCIICDAGVPTTYGLAVGVAFKSASATSDLIALDTEGIWNLTVYAEDDDGDRAIEAGDRLYIRAGALPGVADGDGTGDAEISKISNSVVQVPFGYALGSVVAGGSGVIAVKVHFDPILIGDVANKGLDHVQGTTTNPIAWGITGNHVKANVFTVGVLTDYINFQRIHMLTTDDITAGGVYNIYSRQDVKHDIQNMVGIHALGYVTPDTPAALTINQLLGLSGQVYVNNPGFTVTLSDSISACQLNMDQSLTSTITGSVPAENGWINGLFVYMNGIEHDNSGKAAGVHVTQGGGGTSFPDYGFYLLMESANALAGFKFESKAIGMFAIEFECALGFGYTALLRYSGGATVANCTYFLQCDQAAGAEGGGMMLEENTDNTADSDYQIAVRLAGDTVTRWLRLYN